MGSHHREELLAVIRLLDQKALAAQNELTRSIFVKNVDDFSHLYLKRYGSDASTIVKNQTTPLAQAEVKPLLFHLTRRQRRGRLKVTEAPGVIFSESERLSSKVVLETKSQEQKRLPLVKPVVKRQPPKAATLRTSPHFLVVIPNPHNDKAATLDSLPKKVPELSQDRHCQIMPWRDITIQFDEVVKSIPRHQLLTPSHFKPSFAMTALVVGSPAMDMNMDVANRITLNRYLKLTKGTSPDTEGIATLFDEIAVLSLRYICGCGSRISNLGSLGILHDRPHLYEQQCDCVKVIIDSWLCLCELWTRLVRATMVASEGEFSPGECGKAIRLQLIGDREDEHFTEAELVQKSQVKGIMLLPMSSYESKGALPIPSELLDRLSCLECPHILDQSEGYKVRLELLKILLKVHGYIRRSYKAPNTSEALLLLFHGVILSQQLRITSENRDQEVPYPDTSSVFPTLTRYMSSSALEIPGRLILPTSLGDASQMLMQLFAGLFYMIGSFLSSETSEDIRRNVDLVLYVTSSHDLSGNASRTLCREGCALLLSAFAAFFFAFSSQFFPPPPRSVATGFSPYEFSRELDNFSRGLWGPTEDFSKLRISFDYAFTMMSTKSALEAIPDDALPTLLLQLCDQMSCLARPSLSYKKLVARIPIQLDELSRSVRGSPLRLKQIRCNEADAESSGNAELCLMMLRSEFEIVVHGPTRASEELLHLIEDFSQLKMTNKQLELVKKYFFDYGMCRLQLFTQPGLLPITLWVLAAVCYCQCLLERSRERQANLSFLSDWYRALAIHTRNTWTQKDVSLCGYSEDGSLFQKQQVRCLGPVLQCVPIKWDQIGAALIEGHASLEYLEPGADTLSPVKQFVAQFYACDLQIDKILLKVASKASELLKMFRPNASLPFAFLLQAVETEEFDQDMELCFNALFPAPFIQSTQAVDGVVSNEDPAQT